MKLLKRRIKINNANALCAYVFKGAYSTGNPFPEEYIHACRLFDDDPNFKWYTIAVNLGNPENLYGHNDKNIIAIEILKSNTKMESPKGELYWRGKQESKNDEKIVYYCLGDGGTINGGLMAMDPKANVPINKLPAKYQNIVRDMINDICTISKNKCGVDMDFYKTLYETKLSEI